MSSILKTTAVAGLLGLAALAAAPAKANEFYLNFGGPDPHYVHSDDYRGDYWRSQRRCTPERALHKAQQIGVHRARLDYVSERRIGVVGRSRGERVYLTFARAPNCPIIG